MAEDQESRTEDPTPRRREEARQRGQVAQSQEFTGGVMLLAGIVGLLSLGPMIGGVLLDFFRTSLPNLRFADIQSADASNMFLRVFERGVTVTIGFFGLLMAVAIAVNLIQVGFHLSPEKLELKFDKLDPSQGLQRLFSVSNLIKGLFAIIKIIAMGWIAYSLLSGRIGTLTSLGQESVGGAVRSAWSLIMRIAVILSAVFAVLGILDFIYQKRKFESSLRMTKEEVKRELKEEDGDPQIKFRRRQMARDMMKRKMLTQVPKSTVVVTNPTHVAVALLYEPKDGQAPKVVAKGTGRLAQQIREAAQLHNVPILERPPLARMLYKSVREDQEIPSNLFRAVAEVIAFVYKLKNITAGRS